MRDKNITNGLIPKLCKSNILVDLLLKNSLEIATKLNLYLTKKHVKKIFCKDYTGYEEIIFINNERFWRKEPIKERKNFEK